MFMTAEAFSQEFGSLRFALSDSEQLHPGFTNYFSDITQNKRESKGLSRVLYPGDEWPTRCDAIQMCYERYILALETCQAVTSSRDSLERLWNQSRSSDVAQSLHAYLATLSTHHRSMNSPVCKILIEASGS